MPGSYDGRSPPRWPRLLRAQLTAIASRDRQTARAWAEEYRIPKVHDSYEALLADPAIDAVYIPLPNELHKPWVLAAAQAGKHVLCEKPLALNAAEAQEMVNGCRRHDVILHEAFMWRHQSRVAHARKMLAGRQLGELRLVKMDFSFDIDRTDWRLDPNRGGGAVYDLGCYGINAARLFTGAEPLEVHARSQIHVRSRHDAVDDVAISAKRRRAVGLQLRMSLPQPDRNCRHGRSARIARRCAAAGGDGTCFPAWRVDRHHPLSVERSIRGQIECFCASVAAGRLLDPAEDGLANMKVLDAVRHVLESV